jgi:hypothetical protein
VLGFFLLSLTDLQEYRREIRSADDFSQFLAFARELSTKLHDAVLVDQVVCSFEEREKLLEMLRRHVRNNLVRSFMIRFVYSLSPSRFTFRASISCKQPAFHRGRFFLHFFAGALERFYYFNAILICWAEQKLLLRRSGSHAAADIFDS